MYSRISEKFTPFFIFLFTFFIVSQFGKHFFFTFSYLSGIRTDYLAPTFYFIDILSLPLITVSLFQLARKRKGLMVWISKNSFLCVSLIILLLINFFFSLSRPLWLYWFARSLQLILLFLFFRWNAYKKTVYSSLVWGLYMGACFELILALLQLSLRHSLQGWWYFLGERSFSVFTPGIAKAYFFDKEFLRPYGSFSHPNSLGGFYLFVYSFILTQKRITNSFFKWTFLCITSILVLVSFSRTAIIGYVVINLIYFMWRGISCKTCFLSKILIAFILISFALGISGDINSLQKRTDFFEKSLAIIVQKPFTGVGMGSYLIAQHSYPQRFSTFFEQPVHNVILLGIAQLGIPLGLIWSSFLYLVFKSRARTTSLILPFFVILWTGSVDHYWATLQQNLLVLVLISGILSSYEEPPSGNR